MASREFVFSIINLSIPSKLIVKDSVISDPSPERFIEIYKTHLSAKYSDICEDPEVLECHDRAEQGMNVFKATRNEKPVDFLNQQKIESAAVQIYEELLLIEQKSRIHEIRKEIEEVKRSLFEKEHSFEQTIDRIKHKMDSLVTSDEVTEFIVRLKAENDKADSLLSSYKTILRQKTSLIEKLKAEISRLKAKPSVKPSSRQ